MSIVWILFIRQINITKTDYKVDLFNKWEDGFLFIFSLYVLKLHNGLHFDLIFLIRNGCEWLRIGYDLNSHIYIPVWMASDWLRSRQPYIHPWSFILRTVLGEQTVVMCATPEFVFFLSLSLSFPHRLAKKEE